MYRVTIGALCLAACLFTVLEVRRTRRALGAVALEKIESAFDVVEDAFHLAYTHLNWFA